MKKKKGLFKISYKITIMVITIIAVSTAAVGVLSYISFRNASIRLLSQNLLAVSRSAAALIDPVQYREIMANKEPNDYHIRLSEYFTSKVHEHDIFFLHAGEIDPEIGFVGFVEAQLHDFGTGLGEITPADQFPAEALSAMAHGYSYVTDTFYALDYGWDIAGALLLVAYAPVLDEYGNTIAIVSAVEIDTGVYDYSREFAFEMIVMSLLSMLILIWIPIFFARRIFSKPISRLSAATNAIVNGDMSGDLSRDSRIFSNDELGELAENFSAMQTSIRENAAAEYIAHQSELARKQAEAVTNAMRDSAVYARKLQMSVVPSRSLMKSAFSDFSLIWKPRDIVGGDIHWMKQFDNGTVLYAADCTGHGTPGALLTMLVVSALESIVHSGNCDDPAEVVYQLDRKLANTLNVKQENELTDINDGCDIVGVFIAKDGSIKFSHGNANLFVCDGKETVRYKGQRLFVGEGKLTSKNEVQVFNIPANPDNKFYVVSDGLYEQPGGEHGRTYGFRQFSQILLDNHSKKHGVILGKVWEAFEEYRGDEPMVDDFALLAFSPRINS